MKTLTLDQTLALLSDMGAVIERRGSTYCVAAWMDAAARERVQDVKGELS